MLTIVIPASELWDERKQEFVYTKKQVLQLEHSLVSISKWEEKWNKTFLSKIDKTYEETIDYIRCMTITQNVSPETYKHLPKNVFDEINEYINAPMTALQFPKLTKDGSVGSKETVTSEIIYYWMIVLGIPTEYRKWHLNKLLALIQVCNLKNQPTKKMSAKELMSRNTTLNEARRKQYNSKG